jgi:hypothetical protein
MANESIQFNLVEALRRFECFGVAEGRVTWCIDDLVNLKWTVLAYASEMRKTTAQGYMVVAGHYEKRCLGWYQLTEKGAKIVLKWHEMGVHCFDYNVVGTPPFYKDIEKQL